MSEIEVGDYIRTKDGIIAKVTYSDCMMLDCDRDVFDLENLAMMEIPTEYISEYVKKHSKNIIDLIEVGDIVETEIICSLETNGILHSIIDVSNKEHLEALKSNEDTKILSILTHEQYEKNCYKLEE